MLQSLSKRVPGLQAMTLWASYSPCFVAFSACFFPQTVHSQGHRVIDRLLGIFIQVAEAWKCNALNGKGKSQEYMNFPGYEPFTSQKKLLLRKVPYWTSVCTSVCANNPVDQNTKHVINWIICSIRLQHAILAVVDHCSVAILGNPGPSQLPIPLVINCHRCCYE